MSSIFVAAGVLLLGASTGLAAKPANTIYYNGLIYAGTGTVAEAMAVRADKVLSLGRRSWVQETRGSGTVMRDLKTATIIPGVPKVIPAKAGLTLRDVVPNTGQSVTARAVITPGAPADFIILSGNPLKAQTEQGMWNIRVLEIVRGGKRVYNGWGSKPLKAAAPAGGLTNVEWRLRELNGSAVAVSQERMRPTLALVMADGKNLATGTGGCNRFSGSYAMDGGRITFGPSASTMKACLDGMETEAEYFKALSTVDSWRMEGSEFVLSSGSAQVARFTRGAAVSSTGVAGAPAPVPVNPEGTPEAPVAGTVWGLIRLNNRDITYADGTQPTLSFDAAGGTVSGSGGCNRFNGPCTVNGSSVSFGALATTRKMCPDVMELEQEYLMALAKVTGWRVSAGRLLLLQGDDPVASFVKK